LNEERNLPYVFDRLPENVDEVILVDGGSVDRTIEVARQLRPSVIVVKQTRTGKGNALACGFAAATSDIIVMIDADGSTDPAEIPRFVAALTAGADFAKGTRFHPDGGSDDITPLRRIGNAGLNGLVNLLFRTHFSDLCYGYNAFWRRLLPSMALPEIGTPAPADGGKLWGDGFEIETLINVRVAAAGYSIEEVGSYEAERRYGQSNLNTFRDGFRVLRTVLTEFRRHRSGGTPRKSVADARLDMYEALAALEAEAREEEANAPAQRRPPRTSAVATAAERWHMNSAPPVRSVELLTDTGEG
jgi:glycosyltransferase involved in cell wall biosynthesis